MEVSIGPSPALAANPSGHWGYRLSEELKMSCIIVSSDETYMFSMLL